MIATRLLILGFVTLLAGPALATIAIDAPYEGIGTGGTNNVIDATPLGACFDVAGGCSTAATACFVDGDCPASETCSAPAPVSGCRDVNGDLCRSNGQCLLERVPAGRCSRGTSLTCLWPLGAGVCNSDSNQACITNGDCTTGTCNTGGINPACACQGSNSAAAQYETTVCTGTTDANLGICSDGDDNAFTAGFDDRKWGSDGTALCVALNVVGTALTVCGEEGGESLSGTRYPRENAPVAPTPQRRPGLAGLDTNPITWLRATSRNDYEAVDGNGVRRFFAPGDSLWNDAAFGNRLFTGGATSSSIITYQCDQFAQPTGQAFNPGGGTCSIGGAACTFNTQCPLGAVCNGIQYCYSSGIAVDNPGFIWTSGFTPDPNAACPPNCGTSYDFNTYEQEEIERVGAIDDNVGTQLALDSLGAPQADVGDSISQLRVVSFTWIGDTDQRCFVTGEPGAPAGEVGKCAGGSRTCNPDRGPGQPFQLGTCSITVATTCDTDAGCPASETCVGGCPAGELCERCNSSTNQAGLCTLAQTSCQTNADCAAGTCSFAHLNAANVLNQPGDYNDGGFAALKLDASNPTGSPRVGLISARAPDVRVPLFLNFVTGDMSVENRDNDTGGNDTAELGFTVGGGAGIGTAQTFTSGQVLPWRAGLTPNQASQTIGVAGANPGTPVGRLMRTYDWGSGPDGIPGCLGDTSLSFIGPTQALGACNDRLGLGPKLPGIALPGENTGGNDPSLRRAEIAGCNLTCVGAASAQRGQECPIAGVRCDTTAGGTNDQNSASICACGGMDATEFSADVLIDPDAILPDTRSLGAGTARDITVLASKDTDVSFKVSAVNCPWKGSCSTAATDCADDADCPASETCAGIALTCSTPPEPCLGIGDYDGDGICDNVDNCKYQWNPGQEDAGFVGLDPPNGRGDACECGDVTGDGKLSLADFAGIRKFVAGGANTVFVPANAANIPKCDVSGDQKCTLADFAFVRKAVAGDSSLIIPGTCFPAIP